MQQKRKINNKRRDQKKNRFSHKKGAPKKNLVSPGQKSGNSYNTPSEGEILYGIHPLIECLKAGKRSVLSIYTTRPAPKGWNSILPLLKHVKNIQYVTRDILTRMAGSPDHMGVVAWVSSYQYTTKEFTPQEKKRILVLDGVQDVRNMGGILRSAYCTDIDAVVLASKKTAPMTAAVFKSSAGLAEHLDIYRVPSLGAAVDSIGRAGYKLFMAVVDGGEPIESLEIKKDDSVCIVIGSEGSGISKSIQERGIPVTLNQKDTSSYNASVAAGIFLYFLQYSQK